MSIHQCAQYSHNKHRRYKLSANRIVNYLIRMKYNIPRNTGYMGLVVDIIDEVDLDVFVDANCFGLWGRE